MMVPQQLQMIGQHHGLAFDASTISSRLTWLLASHAPMALSVLPCIERASQQRFVHSMEDGSGSGQTS